MCTDLRRWHPRAVERERAALGLGLVALSEDDTDAALEWFDRCIAESLTGFPGNEARLEKAALLRRTGRPAEAAVEYERVTTSRLAASGQKAKALLGLGHCALDAGDLQKAAARFERCCLSGARFKETAAEAWLHHGLVLEKLRDRAAALTAYRTLLEKKDLAFLPPARQARERLLALEGGPPP